MTTITQLKEVDLEGLDDEQLLALDTLEETLSLPVGVLKTYLETYLNGKYARLAAANTFTQGNTFNTALTAKAGVNFQTGANAAAVISQGVDGKLNVTAGAGVNLSTPPEVTVPVPAAEDNTQKAAPTKWVRTHVSNSLTTKEADLDKKYAQLAGNNTMTGTNTFSGSVTVPAPAAADNSTKPSTTAWVRTHVAGELATKETAYNAKFAQVAGNNAMTGNNSFSGTSTFTGAVTVPAPAATDNSTKPATTAWARTYVAGELATKETAFDGKYARLAAANTFTAANTFNGNVTEKGVLYFQNGSNAPAGINQGTSGQLYISATGGVDMTAPTSVTVPVPDQTDNTQKAAPTQWVKTYVASQISGVGGGIPAGTIAAWGSSTAPSGWLICNGGAVSRTTYPQLFAAIGTSFGSGNGNSTFNLPNFVNHLPVNTGGYIGNTSNGALPNITGYLGIRQNQTGVDTGGSSGALSYTQGLGYKHVGTLADDGTVSINFDASRSNTIYKSTTYALPAYVESRYIIKY